MMFEWGAAELFGGNLARDWNESLAIKGKLPLGEDQIKRLLQEADSE